MSAPLTDPDELVALGAFAGAQVLVVIFSVFKANAYRDRAFLFHASASLMAIVVLQNLAGKQRLFPQAVLLLVMAFAGLQLRDLVAHAGGLRHSRRWLVGVSLGLMPALALASIVSPWTLAVGSLSWGLIVAFVMQQAWKQSRPWMGWLVPGIVGLTGAGLLLTWYSLTTFNGAHLTVGALLVFWTVCVYIATDWRGRLLGETRARVDARSTVDPLTGLAMPMVMNERIHAARTMMLRYGHPSVLLLVYCENLSRISTEFGPEAGESAVLTAANRVRQSIREGDVAARLTHSRFAVLAEGISTAEAAANVASRILVAGLKEPLPALPAEFLHFRIVLAAVPAEDISAKQLLQRLGTRLDDEMKAPSERRIITLANEEVLA